MKLASNIASFADAQLERDIARVTDMACEWDLAANAALRHDVDAFDRHMANFRGLQAKAAA